MNISDNYIKDIEEINKYDYLKKQFYVYRYNTGLGKNLDIYV